MKLEKVLDNLNSFEKNSFLKIINDIISSNPRNNKEIDKILSNSKGDLKSIDNQNIANVFSLVESEFSDYLLNELTKSSNQFDILSDILIRDGNCIMKQEWFSRLYEKEIKTLRKQVKEVDSLIKTGSGEKHDSRVKEYKIYKRCLEVAYKNDDENNLERKVTVDEQSILNELSAALELSLEEIKWITYTILPIQPLPIDEVVNDLKNCGAIFYSKKQNTVYVADEIVRVIRTLRGKLVADKYVRRTLRLLKDAQINLICRKHGIPWKDSVDVKIQNIIHEGINFIDLLSEDIFKDDITLTERKKFINDLCSEKGLDIASFIKGATLDEKIGSIIDYFNQIELDEKIGISGDGFDKLLNDLNSFDPKINTIVKFEFQLQEENVLNNSLLADYNIKPRDVLYLLPKDQLKEYCLAHEIKSRGDLISNILESYTDTANLFLENYDSIAKRDLKTLKDNGIDIKEAEVGLKFEELTKEILKNLGFNVDEDLRKSLNTSKDKIDIVLNLGSENLIVVECKTSKDKGYNKFSAVSRQLKSYSKLASKNGYQVIKSLLIAPEFSDDFVSDCELEYELNLSLITSYSLLNIMEGFKNSNHDQLPYKLLMRDVLIQEDRIIKALKK